MNNDYYANDLNISTKYACKKCKENISIGDNFCSTCGELLQWFVRKIKIYHYYPNFHSNFSGTYCKKFKHFGRMCTEDKIKVNCPYCLLSMKNKGIKI